MINDKKIKLLKQVSAQRVSAHRDRKSVAPGYSSGLTNDKIPQPLTFFTLFLQE